MYLYNRLPLKNLVTPPDILKCYMHLCVSST